MYDLDGKYYSIGYYVKDRRVSVSLPSLDDSKLYDIEAAEKME